LSQTFEVLALTLLVIFQSLRVPIIFALQFSDALPFDEALFDEWLHWAAVGGFFRRTYLSVVIFGEEA
jgi:hypothetical protein